MSNQSNKLIETAKYYVGYLEKASNNQLDDFTANAGSSNYTLFGKWYGLNPDYWCAMFVSYCADKAGIQTSIIPKHAYCPDGVNWFKSAGRWHSRQGYQPVSGDIIYYASDGYTASHIGIVYDANSTTVYTIEGNTSGGSTLISNGGGVAKKSYPLTYTNILGYGNPAYVQDIITVKEVTTSMNTVKGSTVNEINLIKGIQSTNGSVVDGEIGTQTLSDIACKLGAIKSPITLQIYGVPVIIGKDIAIAAPTNKPLSYFDNSMNGMFFMVQDVGGNVPCSICVHDGVVFCATACHSDAGYPETVIYKTVDEIVGIATVKNISEIPYKLKTAVGGLGLLDHYNPNGEGFVGKFSDVVQINNHSMIGYKNGYWYGVYCGGMNSIQINTLAKTLGFTYSVQLDGGHVAGINGTESFAKINTAQIQSCIIQFV